MNMVDAFDGALREVWCVNLFASDAEQRRQREKRLQLARKARNRFAIDIQKEAMAKIDRRKPRLHDAPNLVRRWLSRW